MKVLRLSLLLAIAPACASAADPTTAISRDAQACADALMNGDLEGVVAYTHPRIVEMIGGTDAMVAIIKQGIEKMKRDGVSFSSVSLGAASKAREIGGWLTSIVPQTIVMQVPGGTLTTESALLGISENGGANWVFVDLGPISKAQLQQAFPEIADGIVIPPKKKPVFVEAP